MNLSGLKASFAKYSPEGLLVLLLFVTAGIAHSADHTNSAAGAAKPSSLPPIFLTGERIVFQGDVTVDGGRWRSRDLKKPAWQDYAYIIAAEYGAVYPERHLVFIDRAMQGDRIINLTGRWQEDTLALKPDVVSILIGVNDLRAGAHEGRPVMAGNYEKVYDDLLAGTCKANPRVKLMLCCPFVLPSKYTKPHWDEWMELIRQVEVVVEKLGVKYHAPVAHFQKLFPLTDPVANPAPGEPDIPIPTYAEHRRMADEWVSAYQRGYGPPVKSEGSK